MKNFIKTKWFTLGTYLLLVLAVLMVGYVLMQNNKTLNKVITSFFEVAENRSFDYRQSLRVLHKQPEVDDRIVILAIDDASLEMLWDKYGEWPIPRNVYADIIEHIEQGKPRALVFDLLFIKSMRTEADSDNTLINAMNKYDNIYTAMNFDNQPSDLRSPIDLPERLSLKVRNDSDIDFTKKYHFTNCRPILEKLLNGKVEVGITNVIRNNDGIIRKVAPIMEYKSNLYPYLAYIAGSNTLTSKHTKNFVIDKNRNLIVGDTEIPLTKDGDAILNWYGPSETHTVYPLYKVINELGSKQTKLDFKDKIIINP